MKKAKVANFAAAILIGAGLAACESEYDPTAADTGTANDSSTLEQTRNDSELNATDEQAAAERGTSADITDSPEDIAGNTEDSANDQYSISDERDGTPDTGNWDSGNQDSQQESADTDPELSGTQTGGAEDQTAQESTDSHLDIDQQETHSDVVAKEQQAVQFDFDSAKLTSEARSKLEDFVDSMEERNLGMVEMVIRGYTDTAGSEAYNKALAKRRAESVKSFLQEQGMASEDLKIEAIGEAEDENIAASIQDNRRVVVEVVVPYAEELT